jgi:carbonic anhydrase
MSGGMSIIDELVENNHRYAAEFVDHGLPTEPSRKLAVLTCMDSRIDVFAVLGLQLGEAHVLRNAGGIVTDDALRSLLLSQYLLGTEAVMLIHHTSCGLLRFRDDELAGEVERDTGVRPQMSLGAITDLDESVRTSMQRIRDAGFLPHRDAVRGFVYELDTGRLREVV